MLNAFSSSSSTTLPPEIIRAAKQGALTTIDPKYVDLKDELGRTLAYHALDNNHLELANMLLRLQTDITITTVSGWSILHLIAKKNATTLLKTICTEKEIETNFLLLANASQDTCLSTAAKCGNVDVLAQFLLIFKQKGITDPSIKAKAMVIAAKQDHVACVMVLLEDGTDLNLCNEVEKENFIHLLIRCNAVKTLEAIKDKIGPHELMELWYKQKNQSQLTPLELAISLGHWQAAKILLSLRAKEIDSLQWLTLSKVIEDKPQTQIASTHGGLKEYLPIATQYQADQKEAAEMGFNDEDIPVEYNDNDEITQDFAKFSLNH
ncbi:MAG: hypothetical protein BGO43_11945 [Gammaproteobacteria bacterium 39-13]|nr:hypothetical protein [Gammaproteobacteria bacterium]OJV85331.1 MAG: hypothetical protein BGO43_11945 [Gammaproteobacteria bacterium 39-13]